MEKKDLIITAIQQQKLLPLFYHDDIDVCKEVITVLYQSGIKVIEFTNRGTNALINFTEMVAYRNVHLPDLLLAIGTIKTAEQAKQFIAAGADFLISPVFDDSIADTAYLHKTFWIPGCMTPTEIHRAEKAGCNLIKIFPGNVVGPALVSGIKELFPNVFFMPTGGVELEESNLSAWFNAGVIAVGLGTKVITKAALANKEYVTIETNINTAIQMVARY